MTHGSLFSGIGGFEFAAEAMGWDTLFTCDNDPFCQRVLTHYWPGALHYQDIKQLDATQFKRKIDILTGGFPCQPFSLAGKRKGTQDDRYLWPEMLRVIRDSKPRWIVAENVYGLINWNEGLVFEQVHADLEAEGYEVQSFILPAAGVNAPHRRYRAWIIAYVNGNGRCGSNGEYEKQSGQAWEYAQRHFKQMGIDSHGSFKGLEGEQETRKGSRKGKGLFKQFARSHFKEPWKGWPTEPALCGNNDGLPKKLDGITFPKWRKESIKAYGNAIVPQVVLQIFKAIAKAEE